MKKLFIHIGTHKTGTTAVQKFGRDNEKLFNSCGIKVIDQITLPRRQELVLSQEYNQDVVNAYRTFFKKEFKAPFKRFFVCWEGFSGNARSYYDNTAVTLEMLNKSIPEGVQIEIIVAFRRQDDFLQSVYNQQNHEGQFVDASHFLKVDYHKGLDWWDYITVVRSQFNDSQIHVIPYDKVVLRDQNLIQIIGRILDCTELTDVRKLNDANIGFTKEAADFFKRVSSKLKSEKEVKLLRRFLQQSANKGALKEYDLIPLETKMNILSLYAESNKKVAKQYWSEFYGMENFSLPENMVSNDTTSLLDDVVIALIGALRKESSGKNRGVLERVAINLYKLFKSK